MKRDLRAIAALIGGSFLGLSTQAVGQPEANQPADQTGGNQDVVPGGVPEAAIEANDANAIVVEARRRDESAQDVPLVVNAVTAEAITELNLRDFKDIQTVVPGLLMTSNANGIGTTSSVRGVNFDVGASGNAGTIEYYLNDAPITSGALFNAMYDIGQIEVLRGPQGTLRGRAAPSGSITVAHRKPDLDEVGGYALGTVNNIGGANVNAAVGAPIVPGILAVRVAGLVERGRGSRVRSISSSLDPWNRTKSGRVFLRAQPTDWLNAEGVYQRIEQRNRSYDQVACFDQFNERVRSPFTAVAQPCPVEITPGDRLSTAPGPRRTEQKFDIFTWKASAGFGGQRLFYVGAHTRQKVDTYDNFGANANGSSGSVPGGVGLVPAGPLLVGRDYGQFTSNDSRVTSHEARLQNDERIANLFDYVVGYFHSKLDSASVIYSQTPLINSGIPGFRISPSGTLRPITTTEKSFFGNLTLHLGDATEISGGARRIKFDTLSALRTASPPGVNNGLVGAGTTNAPLLTPGAVNLFPLLAPEELADIPGITLPGGAVVPLSPVDRTFHKTIFSASAKHRFSDDFMVYANFGTSWRPGVNVTRSTVNFQPTSSEVGFIVLPPETSKSYEVGLKSEFFDDTVKLNVAAFRQDYRNYPYRSQSGIPYLNFASVAAARSTGALTVFNYVAPVPVRVHGAEAELTWRPSDRFNIGVNLSYALGKIRNGLVPCADTRNNSTGVLGADGTPDPLPPAVASELIATLPAGQNVATCRVNFRSSTSAPFNGNLQAEYSLPVSNASEGFIRGLLTFSGKSRNDEANAFDDYGAYGLLNLYAGLRDPSGAWEVTLYGKNVTKQNTILATSNGNLVTTVRNPGVSNLQSPYIGLGSASIPGLTAPRELGITGRFAFGSR